MCIISITSKSVFCFSTLDLCFGCGITLLLQNELGAMNTLVVDHCCTFQKCPYCNCSTEGAPFRAPIMDTSLLLHCAIVVASSHCLVIHLLPLDITKPKPSRDAQQLNCICRNTFLLNNYIAQNWLCCWFLLAILWILHNSLKDFHLLFILSATLLGCWVHVKKLWKSFGFRCRNCSMWLRVDGRIRKSCSQEYLVV